jgi:hypothetical protein
MTMWFAIPFGPGVPQWRIRATSPGRMSAPFTAPSCAQVRGRPRRSWYSRTPHHSPSAQIDTGVRPRLVGLGS